MNTVSVIIPTFNRLDSLPRAIESVLSQTKTAEELIVVDDGSTDGTGNWVKETYPDVILIQQANQGVSAARNAGIRRATTEWIAFLDSDDVWLPTKLAKQLLVLDATPDYKICHTEERWIYNGQERPVATPYKKQAGWIFEACLPVCAISPSTVLIHRNVFDQVGLFDESLPACEDYDLWLRVTSRMPVLLIDVPLIEKHGGRDDQLATQWGLDRWRIQALKKVLNEGHLTEDQQDLAKKQLVEKCVIFASGLEKHGKDREAKYYLEIIAQG